MYCYLFEHFLNIQEIAPPEPIRSGRQTGVTGSFKFDENL